VKNTYIHKNNLCVIFNHNYIFDIRNRGCLSPSWPNLCKQTNKWSAK